MAYTAILLLAFVCRCRRIVRYIRTGAEAQDSLSAMEEHVIRFDRPASRADPSLSTAIPAAGDIDF